MIRISVVIPTRDRPGPLAACLGALSASFPPDAETVVVSDGGAEDLGPVVAPFVDSLRLRLLRVEHGGPAAARNRGLEVSRGQIVAFTDDDCLPQPGWVASLASGVRFSPPCAVGGSTRVGTKATLCAEAAQLVLVLLSRHDRALSGRERLLPSNNFACPADALVRMEGFDESFRTAEDRELCRRWARAGFELGRVPEAIVEHNENLDLGGFVRKFFAYGRGAARFHGSGADPSLRESTRFHFRLPALVIPELRQKSLARSAAIAVLLLLWEISNVAGYLAEKVRGGQEAPEAAEVKAAAKVL